MDNLIEIHSGVGGRIRISTVKVKDKDKSHFPRLIQLPQISDAEENHLTNTVFCPPDRHLPAAV